MELGRQNACPAGSTFQSLAAQFMLGFLVKNRYQILFRIISNQSALPT